jgi:hypothetical protein
VHKLLEVLRREAPSFGPALARTALDRGLAVTAPDGALWPIPITATPVVLEANEIRAGVETSARLTSAALRVARWVLRGADRELLASALSPLERKIAFATYAAVQRLATARVDYFFRRSGLAALEINATIPAMQGYSDIAAESFIEAVGRAAGLDASAVANLKSRNGSNAEALYQALLASFAAERSGRPERIGLLCRREDPQLTEVAYLAERFRAFGTDADVLFPDELSGADQVRARGKTYALIYRHLFVRRLEQLGLPYLEELFAEIPGKRAVVLNPPASQVEVKTTFALLSQASADPQLAESFSLTEEELAVSRRVIPWTRIFRPGPTTDWDGQPVGELVSWVADDPRRFVLKRSWDYGGKAVFIGRAAEDASFGVRTIAAYGRALSWPELCQRAATDRFGGGFVVQEAIETEPQQHVLCFESSTSELGLYVDFSAYASVGLPEQPSWGGVCRGSISPVVNIASGGGVLPLITAEVAELLRLAFERREQNGGLQAIREGRKST